jgi:glycosyltransferase involved in cell wall biosynthesis
MVFISVLMCVYNREKYLSAAIDSILNQSFRDFDFEIVDDGSTDRSSEILHAYAKKDNRIKVIHNKENLGIARSVTKGLTYCQGKYILRMDSDDISMPQRFQVQFEYMEAHPEIDALGTSFDFIDELGKKTGKYVIYPTDPLLIRFEMFYRCMLHNPTVIAKSDFYRKFNENNEEEQFIGASDYAFWMRMNLDHIYANLADRLLLYRLHAKQITSTGSMLQRDTFISAAQMTIQKLIGKPIRKSAVKAFYLSKHFTSDDPQIVRQGLRIMFQIQRSFEKAYSLSKDQRYETRILSYEKIKSYLMKYKRDAIILMMGGVYLLQLLPGVLVKEILEIKNNSARQDLEKRQ